MLIEEVRRWSAPKATVSTDVAPYRPDLKDETFRRVGGRFELEAEAESVAALGQTGGRVIPVAPSHASSSSAVAAVERAGTLEPGSSPFSTGTQRPRVQSEARDGTRAAPLVLASPLPPAGLRATLTSRLHTPFAKKRRLELGGGGGSEGRPQPLGTTETSGSPRPATAPTSAGIANHATVPAATAATAAAAGEGVPSTGSLGTGEGGEGDRAARRRGAVVVGGGPWKGMNFADTNAADDNVSSRRSKKLNAIF